MDAYKGVVTEEIPKSVLQANRLKWVSKEELQSLAFPVSYQKVYNAYQ